MQTKQNTDHPRPRVFHDKRKGEWVEIAFRDTGRGIPPEELERIFDPFYTRDSTGKGTGLGLSLCYAIIKQHRGSIHVESEPDKGTVFTLLFPVFDEEAGSPRGFAWSEATFATRRVAARPIELGNPVRSQISPRSRCATASAGPSSRSVPVRSR